MSKVISKKSKKHNFNPIKVEPQYDEVIAYDNPKVVEEMEKQWPEMTAEFKRIMFTQYELFCLKQSNYGPDNISVGSNLQTEEEKKVSLTGLWFRMNDKIQRLKTLLMSGKTNAVQDEPMEDAYLDVSNYGIMATIVGRGKWGK